MLSPSPPPPPTGGLWPPRFFPSHAWCQAVVGPPDSVQRCRACGQGCTGMTQAAMPGGHRQRLQSLAVASCTRRRMATRGDSPPSTPGWFQLVDHATRSWQLPCGCDLATQCCWVPQETHQVRSLLGGAARISSRIRPWCSVGWEEGCTYTASEGPPTANMCHVRTVLAGSLCRQG